MVESHKYITKSLLFEQLEGGSFGSIRLLVDTIKKKIYAIPISSFHSIVAALLIGITLEKLQKNPQSASYLVPAVIEVNNNKMIGAIVGKSSLEIKIHVKHSQKELAEAEYLIRKFLALSFELRTIDIKGPINNLIQKAT